MSQSQPPPPPPSDPPSAPPPPSQQPVPAPDSKGFVGRVFDLSFSEFVTPSLIKIIFLIGILFAALMSLLVFVSLANQGGAGVVAGLVLAPLIFFVYVLMARVFSEIYLVLFRIEANTRNN
jgi:hypothetical protein